MALAAVCSKVVVVVHSLLDVASGFVSGHCNSTALSVLSSFGIILLGREREREREGERGREIKKDLVALLLWSS